MPVKICVLVSSLMIANPGDVPLMTPAKVAPAVPFVLSPEPKPIVSVLLPSVTLEDVMPASEAMDWFAPSGKAGMPPMFSTELPVPPTSIVTDVRPAAIGSAFATFAFRMPLPPPTFVLVMNVGPRYVLAAFRFVVTPVTIRSSLKPTASPEITPLRLMMATPGALFSESVSVRLKSVLMMFPKFSVPPRASICEFAPN